MLRQGAARAARLTALRVAVLASSPACARCGDPATDIAYVVAPRDGGSHGRENLRAVCDRCLGRPGPPRVG